MSLNFDQLPLLDLDYLFPYIAPKNEYRILEFYDIEDNYGIVGDFPSFEEAIIIAKERTKDLILTEACVFDDTGKNVFYGRSPPQHPL